jgi:hypothetical protein
MIKAERPGGRPHAAVLVDQRQVDGLLRRGISQQFRIDDVGHDGLKS